MTDLPVIPAWIATHLPGGVRREVIDAAGMNMHVMRWGEGRPVWLQHGNPTWGFLYRDVVAELLDCGVELICPDLVGLGLSDRPEAGWHTLAHHASTMSTE